MLLLSRSLTARRARTHTVGKICQQSLPSAWLPVCGAVGRAQEESEGRAGLQEGFSFPSDCSASWEGNCEQPSAAAAVASGLLPARQAAVRGDYFGWLEGGVPCDSPLWGQPSSLCRGKSGQYCCLPLQRLQFGGAGEGEGDAGGARARAESGHGEEDWKVGGGREKLGCVAEGQRWGALRGWVGMCAERMGCLRLRKGGGSCVVMRDPCLYERSGLCVL